MISAARTQGLHWLHTFQWAKNSRRYSRVKVKRFSKRYITLNLMHTQKCIILHTFKCSFHINSIQLM